MGIKVEIDGTIYNKIYAFIISIPIMLGLLIAVTLGVYVQSPVITVNFVNVGLEISDKFLVWGFDHLLPTTHVWPFTANKKKLTTHCKCLHNFYWIAWIICFIQGMM
jgi:hypothetical protein